MKRPKTFLIGGAVLLLASCRHAATESSGDGVIIRLKPKNDLGARAVRVQVITRDIFRITATPREAFAGSGSLSVIKGPAGAGTWSFEETDGSVEVATSTSRARVSLSTGQVSFLDTPGRVILEEGENGRSFANITVNETPGFTMRQVFGAPEDEAFYGLGQHQSGEINYKGRSKELFQYNTKASVPFVVSTANYGLLFYGSTVTWEGTIEAPETGRFRFGLYSAG
jgi:alpha-D-xyloside xylohydrolase